MILSLTDVRELKKEVEQQFSVKVHFCDSCGGQSFTVESPTEELKEFISTFFAKKNLKAVFSEDGKYFTVKRNS